MRLIITDTNVLFDLIKIGALPEFFSLDYEICTTEFVIGEIKPDQQLEQVETFIRSNQLTVFRFNPEDIEEIEGIKTDRDLKRFTDKTVIWKSMQLQCIMLTGDKKMKEVAGRMGIEVHGSIWVIDELIRSQLISTPKAIEFLDLLKTTNSWLPSNEIEKRINRLIP